MIRTIKFVFGALILLVASYSQVATAGIPNPGVLPVKSHAYGMSYGEWGQAFNNWLWQFSLADFPLLQGDGATDCGLGQSGKVWFLAGVLGGTVERSCAIPPGKALFISLNSVLSFAPYFGSNEEEIRADAKRDLDGTSTTTGVEEIKVWIDGVELNSLFSYRASSPAGGFVFTIGEGTILTQIDPPLPADDYYPAIVDGYWLMLPPLSAGNHTIQWVSSGQNQYEEVYSYDVTWHLTISEH